MSAYLVVAHSSGRGGAESALTNLLRLLRRLGHEPVVLLPHDQGWFADWCRREEIEGLILPMRQALRDTSATLLQVSQQDLASIAAGLSARGFVGVITNTAVMVHGMRLAELLDLPHLMWVHELIDDHSEVRSCGMPSAAYLRLIGRGSDHLLCCSAGVQDHLRACGVDTPSSVLYPFTEHPQYTPQPRGADHGRIELLVIGGQYVRKNPVFALTVLQALRLRGHDAVLHLIGAPGSQTRRLQKAIAKRQLGEFVQQHGELIDPYTVAGNRAINLISASHEAFGLTIPESLSRAIPVVATRSGGPNELLHDDDLFALGDLDACVRRIEHTAANYATAAEHAKNRYDHLRPLFDPGVQQQALAYALYEFAQHHASVARQSSRYYGPNFRDAIQLSWLPAEALINNIAAVAKLGVEEVAQAIIDEVKSPGHAVNRDCQTFDVVPFSWSPRNDALYREGLGFAIELAATHADQGRLLMSAFILTRLIHESESRSLKILALGDGIGTDSMRMAALGLDLDYLDFDQSITARVARKNFESLNQFAPASFGRVRVIDGLTTRPHYDVVVCLEVIEHVEKPLEFLRMISHSLAPGGLLFISECFDGIRNAWPSHLATNEEYCGLIPLMATEFGLMVDDINPNPLGKPYVLKKIDPNSPHNLGVDFRGNPILAYSILQAQMELV